MAHFPLCLNTSTIRPASLPDKIEAARAAGYDAIEPWNDEIDSYLAAGGTLPDLRKRIDDSGLAVVSMIALFGWCEDDPDVSKAALDECRRRIDQAAALGSPFIVASPPDGEVDLGEAAERFATLREIGRNAGVEVAMEFLGFVRGVRTLGSALRIAEGGNRPPAPIVADVYHLLRGGGSIDDLLTLTPDRLAIFHFNDLPASPPFSEQTDNDRVMPGDGIADLARVVSNLRTIGYRGPVSLELFNEKLWEENPHDVARFALERMKALLG